MLNFSIIDNATPRLRSLIYQLKSTRGLMTVLGRELERVLRDHFASKEKIPNKHRWPRTHFWSKEIRNNTAFESATENKATVKIASRAFATHYFPSHTIKPKEKKFLSIPLIARAYGKWPSWWKSGGKVNLFPFRTASGKLFLAQKTKGKDLVFWYLLLKKVTTKKDPTALPPIATVMSKLMARVESYVVRALGGTRA